MDEAKIQQGVRLILEGIGENPDRPGLKETPRRVYQMLSEIFSGLAEDPKKYLVSMDGEKHDEMVLVKDITLQSVCEHHLLPFIGVAHIAYIPSRKGGVVGLSKLARVVEILAKRPQVQERLTKELADMIVEAIHPLGVMVVIEAEHLCMSMRGVKKPHSITVTSAVRGSFRTNPTTRSEALALILDRYKRF